jgi:hypothetical protein
MKSLFKQTILGNYTRNNAFQANIFALYLKSSSTINQTEDPNTMLLSNNQLKYLNLLDKKKKLKFPLYLKTFKTLGHLFNNSDLNSNIIVFIYFKKLLFSNLANKLNYKPYLITGKNALLSLFRHSTPILLTVILIKKKNIKLN